MGGSGILEIKGGGGGGWNIYIYIYIYIYIVLITKLRLSSAIEILQLHRGLKLSCYSCLICRH